ncbi:hypothetical protein QBC37DRAFT_299926 [Rhypophila decipiens]|uniref:Uncharacterized protein n=1 Tax=Rhypophila decipiens TaxID=261697 RepID=A0AAN6XU01_9PEZI|nr:hypothetical protein QBC37DRAFT_299926 [Rhypophila decipiens]
MQGTRRDETPRGKESHISLTNSPSSATDVILPMSEPYTSLVLYGHKTYEFRKYKLKPTIKRIWFYRTAPYSALTHIAEIAPAHVWSTDGPLPDEDGVGNKEYNDPRQVKQWRRRFGEFAYKILAVWELRECITLSNMKERYGIKGPPRGLVYLPSQLGKEVVWHRQRKILDEKRMEKKN